MKVHTVNEIGAEGARALARSLKVNTTLSALLLRGEKNQQFF